MTRVNVNMIKNNSRIKTTNTPPGPSKGIKPVDGRGMYWTRRKRISGVINAKILDPVQKK